MVRLKIKNLNRAITELTSVEMSIYIYIAQRASLCGIAEGIKMSSAINECRISKQSYYNALRSLEKKAFILENSSNRLNQILILDNCFKSENDCDEPYLNLNMNFLRTTEFHCASIGLKKFLLRALCFKNQSAWNITQNLLKQYKVKIEELNKFFKIKVSGKSLSLQCKEKLTRAASNIHYLKFRQKIELLMKKHKVMYDESSLTDATRSITNFRELPSIIGIALEATIKKGSLEPKLITSILYRCKNKKNALA